MVDGRLRRPRGPVGAPKGGRRPPAGASRPPRSFLSHDISFLYYQYIDSMTTRKTKRPSLPKSSPTFTRKHYRSNDGMLPPVWGPSFWHVLHTISFNYPVRPSCQQKRQYRNFVLSLENILPCGKCRVNLHKNFLEFPLTMKHMESRTTFSTYIYKLHELVNRNLHKHSGLSYADVRERYEHFRVRCLISPEEKKYLREKEKTEDCVEPMWGEKPKCTIHIVPDKTKCDTLTIDKSCFKQRLP